MSLSWSTSSWRARADPVACPGLAGLVTGLHVAVAIAPWAAGCGPLLSIVLGSASLAGLPGALRAVPGRRCPLRSLTFEGGCWSARLAGGEERPASVEATTRVLPGMLFCRVSVGGRRFDWWVPRHALATTEFRRLKVAMRCRSPAATA